MTDPTTLPEPYRVEVLELASKRHPVQIWHDDWSNEDRIARYTGPCLYCSRSTWSFDDGQDDPRGPLGDHASTPIDVTVRGADFEVPACAICANDEYRYHAAQDLATTMIRRGDHILDRWRPFIHSDDDGNA